LLQIWSKCQMLHGYFHLFHALEPVDWFQRQAFKEEMLYFRG